MRCTLFLPIIVFPTASKRIATMAFNSSAATSATPSAKPLVAFIYDFDGTLIPGNMQEYGFIKELGTEGEEGASQFWKEVQHFKKKYGIEDTILAYMQYMLREAARRDVPITEEDLRRMGKNITFFPGVTTWFDALDAKWSSFFELKHYVISAGIREIIEGCAIQHFFEKVYACRFYYDGYKRPLGPAEVVNFTAKTQYLFRINKQTDDMNKLNEPMPETKRPVPFRRMLYFGDGPTDIPCMSLVKGGGGHVFGIYDRNKESLYDTDCHAKKAVADGRAQLALGADYSKGKDIWKAVDKVLRILQIEEEIKRGVL